MQIRKYFLKSIRGDNKFDIILKYKLFIYIGNKIFLICRKIFSYIQYLGKSDKNN